MSVHQLARMQHCGGTGLQTPEVGACVWRAASQDQVIKIHLGSKVSTRSFFKSQIGNSLDPVTSP